MPVVETDSVGTFEDWVRSGNASPQATSSVIWMPGAVLSFIAVFISGWGWVW